MGSFSPNLPVNNVKTVVMSTIDNNILNRVEALGIKVIPSEKIETFIPFEQTHADMQLFHYDEDTVFVLKECVRLKTELTNHFKNVIETSQNAAARYPDNVLVNAISLNNRLICNINSIDSKIKNIAKARNQHINNVKQGYTKCSVCIVSDEAIITSDKSIYIACRDDYDVLLIRPGYINLPGTKYGFIGGCSFKYNKNILMFTGNIKCHPDYKIIKAFCRNHNVYAESLVNNNLIDIGSIIPVS